MAAGVYEKVNYTHFDWKEGLDILIWYGDVESSSCESSGSSSEATHIVQCQAIFSDNQSLLWQIETEGGVTGRVEINKQQFDLVEGTIFIISVEDNITDTQQLAGDLSNIGSNHDDIVAFGLDDPIIKQFIKSVNAAP